MSLDCSCDFDAPEFYHREIRRARKAHKCYECGGAIARGEQYERVRGKWEGYVSAFDTCQRCIDIRTWLRNNLPCLCWTHGNADEDCKEAVADARWRAPEETKGLKFGLLRRMVARDRLNRERRQGTLTSPPMEARHA